MGAIRFLPFVGERYKDSRWQRRVVVLGESHYGQDARPGFTRDVLARLFDGSAPFEHWMNTFTRFASALAGSPQNRVESKEVWDEVLFYNYVQTLLSGPRMAPSPAQLEGAPEAFWEVLRAWAPDVVLAWGARLYEYLPPEGEQGKECNGVPTWIYEPTPNHKVYVLPVDHPSSSRFSPEKWHATIGKFLGQIP